jgi:hypothetical protein
MECKFAFLCDYAAQDRKLHAIGIGFDTILAPSVPYKHAMMCFVAHMQGSIAESGSKELSLRLIDADGADVIPPVKQRIGFQVKPPRLSAGVNFVAQLGNIQFSKYGAYAVHLLVQGEEKAVLSFNVSEPPKPA